MISIKLLCNLIETTLRDGCSPVNLLHFFRTPFPQNISGRLLLALAKRLLFRIALGGFFGVTVWAFLKIEKGKKRKKEFLKPTYREINMKIFHSSFYQNYQMNLSDISIIYGKEMFVVFMYVKQTVLLRNRKVTKGQCIYSLKMKQ